jgi:hypothetical protein
MWQKVMLDFIFPKKPDSTISLDHWIDLGFERGVVFDQEFEQINKIKSDIQVRLNNMIKSTYAAKEQLSGKL